MRRSPTCVTSSPVQRRDAAQSSVTAAESVPELSIVASLYRSGAYIDEFYRRSSAAARALTERYEIVFVNDGSPDDSLELAVALQRGDARIRIVDLSRNFGHHKAMMTGLRYARGSLVFLIDTDLEVAPETLSVFHAAMRDTHVDVVYGVQDVRRERTLDRWAAHLFYTVFNALSTHAIPRNLLTVRLMTRRYVDALLQHEERETLIGGLWVLTGFAQLPHAVTKRSKGATTYNWRRRFAILFHGVTSFSNKPLLWIFYLGCIISALSACALLFLVIHWAFFGGFLVGWASVMVGIFLTLGVNTFCLGIIGLYLSKVFTETKQRPYTIVRAVLECDAK
jgi:putative glycosyltransferase